MYKSDYANSLLESGGLNKPVPGKNGLHNESLLERDTFNFQEDKDRDYKKMNLNEKTGIKKEIKNKKRIQDRLDDTQPQ